MANAVSDATGRQGAHVSEMQRHRLLSAIVEVLGVHGLEGATVARICKRAGVSRRTFYDLFDEREACFLAAFELALGQLAERVGPAYLSERNWCQGVRAALVALLECFDEDPGVARLCLVETLKGQPEVLERRQAVLRALASAVDEGRGESKSADPPPLTAESTVGGALAIVHARLLARSHERAGSRKGAYPGEAYPGEAARSHKGMLDRYPLIELVNPLMSMIVLPYLGPAASRKELEQPLPVSRVARSNGHARPRASDPFKDLPIRITFRTARVLAAIGEQPDASNKEIGEAAGVGDQGQMSKLLHRLQNAGLIENRGEGQAKGEPNAWQLTTRGEDVLHAVAV